MSAQFFELDGLIFEVLDAHAARMDGSVAQARLADGSPAYLKTGTSFGRDELLDEVSVLRALSGTSLVPKVLGVSDDGVTARVLLSVVPGRPLHENVSVVGVEGVVDVCADVLRTLWSGLEFGAGALPDGAAREVASLPAVIADADFSLDEFMRHSGGRPPEEVLHEVTERLARTDTDVFTHGDMCLPNIVAVEGTLEWSLVDLGKAGIGDRFRDLASLKSSLERNVGDAAYPSLLRQLELSDDPHRRASYDMIDWFWYAWA